MFGLADHLLSEAQIKEERAHVLCSVVFRSHSLAAHTFMHVAHTLTRSLAAVATVTGQENVCVFAAGCAAGAREVTN